MAERETDTWLKKNAGRLLRQDWSNPTARAQELYAIFANRGEGEASGGGGGGVEGPPGRPPCGGA
jgi:hypothetical protein